MLQPRLLPLAACVLSVAGLWAQEPAPAPAPTPSSPPSAPSPAPSPSNPASAALTPAPGHEGETVARAVPPSAVMNLVLPTDNDALLRGKPEEFYMYVDRNFEGQASKPWEGGQYGYFRGPVRVSPEQVVYMHFHEGIDIACQKRSEKGEPEDEVRSISDGEVVHVSDLPGGSNYGRYIVIRHNWGEGPFYSLYAHLSKCLVKEGDKVQPRTPIAIMGHTGDGINVQRSHTHLELNLMLNSQFGEWHDTNFKDNPNRHGPYNGLNLSGMDIAALYLAHQKNPALTVAEFLKTQTVVFKVLVPRHGDIELTKTYPWMGEHLDQPSPSVEISFTDGAVPLKIAPSAEAVASPKVSWVKDNGVPHIYYTHRCVSGSGPIGTLTGSGLQYIQLITGDFARAPVADTSKKAPAASPKSSKKAPAKKKKKQDS